MRKYHQLLLLIISIVSLSLFLIYRHEYNRLHYVLEVFNFFGQPCNVTNLEQTENILSQHDWGPMPSWQEHENGYLYSAFLLKKNEARAINVLPTTTTTNDGNKFIPRNCYFWFEDKKKPIIGKFKFSKLSSDTDAHLNLYMYFCNLIDLEQIPYAVSFSYKPKKENELRKMMLVKAFDNHPQINTTICVSPSIYSKRRLIEFISYHQLIGVDTFIFYNRDIPHRIVKFMTNLSKRLGVRLTFLPWNFPKTYTTLTRTIIENDCLLRTLGQTNYAATLELNEYIVPSNTYNFDMLVNRLDPNMDRVALPVQKFCINSIETTKPISMTNYHVSSDDNSNIVRYIHKNNHLKDNIVTFAVDKGQASIHKYVKCVLEPARTIIDKSILKFSTDLTRSTLFQLLLHDQI